MLEDILGPKSYPTDEWEGQVTVQKGDIRNLQILDGLQALSLDQFVVLVLQHNGLDRQQHNQEMEGVTFSRYPEQLARWKSTTGQIRLCLGANMTVISFTGQACDV